MRHSVFRIPRLFGLAVLPLILFLAACSDDQLVKASNAIHDATVAIGTLQSTVIAANSQQLITDDDTAAILSVCFQLNTAAAQASTITRGLSKLAPADRGNLVAILQPMVTQVNLALTNGVINIKDPPTKAKVVLALQTVQTGLTVAQAIVLGVK